MKQLLIIALLSLLFYVTQVHAVLSLYNWQARLNNNITDHPSFIKLGQNSLVLHFTERNNKDLKEKKIFQQHHLNGTVLQRCEFDLDTLREGNQIQSKIATDFKVTEYTNTSVLFSFVLQDHKLEKTNLKIFIVDIVNNCTLTGRTAINVHHMNRDDTSAFVRGFRPKYSIFPQGDNESFIGETVVFIHSRTLCGQEICKIVLNDSLEPKLVPFELTDKHIPVDVKNLWKGYYFMSPNDTKLTVTKLDSNGVSLRSIHTNLSYHDDMPHSNLYNNFGICSLIGRNYSCILLDSTSLELKLTFEDTKRLDHRITIDNNDEDGFLVTETFYAEYNSKIKITRMKKILKKEKLNEEYLLYRFEDDIRDLIHPMSITYEKKREHCDVMTRPVNYYRISRYTYVQVRCIEGKETKC